MYAHRKAMDDHVKVAALLGGAALAADVTDDRLAIRIPNAPGACRVGAGRRGGVVQGTGRAAHAEPSWGRGGLRSMGPHAPDGFPLPFAHHD